MTDERQAKGAANAMTEINKLCIELVVVSNKAKYT